MIDEYWNGKDFERSVDGLGIYLEGLRVGGVLIKIQTERPLNVSLENYHCANLFSDRGQCILAKQMKISRLKEMYFNYY